ncbi:PREDICTED: uncharacterized protein LOC105364712 isoform X2 [Ceratosolen solmsi marchali]|uniref:Uncharacterized protein LOC105364712 isoform X2 n=1 Tax=Ceratosolen solmsi marchali TaxID=326594 RepID=A0AAJ6YMV5_9HYME|nr:PREDICTED: uncharacterized protein LOC105364712 isoform X2 [Ceratosolen solmsi marchali]
MEKVQAEKILGILYCLSVMSSLISVISLVITWQYWAWTLDVCININCSCILYGINTFSTFMGGGVNLCHFGAFGLIPIILIGLCLAIYHGYHSYISRNFEERRSLPSIKNYQTRNSLEGRIMVDGPTPRGPCKHWMIVAFVNVLICCLSLAHAVVLTDGYYKTCNQYRRNLVRLLGSRGQELQNWISRIWRPSKESQLCGISVEIGNTKEARKHVTLFTINKT